MHNPKNSHVIAVKSILRCLKGTLTYGIHFKPGPIVMQIGLVAQMTEDQP